MRLEGENKGFFSVKIDSKKHVADMFHENATLSLIWFRTKVGSICLRGIVIIYGSLQIRVYAGVYVGVRVDVELGRYKVVETSQVE